MSEFHRIPDPEICADCGMNFDGYCAAIGALFPKQSGGFILTKEHLFGYQHVSPDCPKPYVLKCFRNLMLEIYERLGAQQFGPPKPAVQTGRIETSPVVYEIPLN